VMVASSRRLSRITGRIPGPVPGRESVLTRSGETSCVNPPSELADVGLPSRVAGAVARPGSHRTVRTLVVYGSSGRRVMTPRRRPVCDLESSP